MKKSLILLVVLLLLAGIGTGIAAFYPTTKETTLESPYEHISRDISYEDFIYPLPGLETPINPPPEPMPKSYGLPTFKSCEDFIAAFLNGRAMGGNYGSLEGAVPSALGPTPDLASGAAPDHSTTNVQVQGVDETDIVKNDGNYIYLILGRTIEILAAFPPQSAGVVATIDFDETCCLQGLFVEDNRLAVIGASYRQGSTDEEGAVTPKVSTTFIMIYDIAARENPVFVRAIEYEGNYSTSRMIQGVIHVVIATNPYYVPYDKTDLRCEDIVPHYRDSLVDWTSVGFISACECRGIGYIDPEGFTSFISVLSVPLKEADESFGKTVISGYSGNVYASMENLYVASAVFPYYQPQPNTGSQKEV